MDEKIIEGAFTATPEEGPVVEAGAQVLPGKFLKDLFEYIQGSVKDYKDMPLNFLLNAINTVSLSYLVSTDNVEEQKKFLEWTCKASLVEVDRIAQLKADKKLEDVKSQEPQV